MKPVTRRRPGLLLVSVALIGAPFAFGLLRAITTRQDFRYLWTAVAAAAGAGAVCWSNARRPGAGRTGAVLATAFVAATACAALAAVLLGARSGTAIGVVAVGFGICCAVGGVLLLRALVDATV